jgi:integration host factor subunit alpha
VGNTITRAGLTEVAAALTGLSKSDIALIADTMFELMGSALMAGENVKLTGFGSLQVRARAQRVGRNPRTGSEHLISPRHTVVFTPGAQLRKALQDKALPAATASEPGKGDGVVEADQPTL